MNRLCHEQIYVDTNIFIAAVEAFNGKALELFRMAERGLVFLLTSEVTRGELLVKPIQTADEALQERYQNLFNPDNGMSALPIDQEIISAAAEISATRGLELLDAVHCATAETADCTYIISEDRDLRSYSKIDVLSLEDLEALS